MLCVKTMRRLLNVEQAVQIFMPEPEALPVFKCK